MKAGLFTIERISRGRSRLGKATEIDAFRIAATRSEHHIQVLRELILGWNADVELIGKEHVAKALAHGKGGVLWIAHFSFNSLATKKAFREAGFLVHHLSRPEHGFSKSVFGITFLNPLRVKAELPYMASRIVIDRRNPSESMQAAIRYLRRNELVSITAGAWEGQTLVSVDVFGATLELAAGAPRLAIAARAPLLPVFTIRPAGSQKIQVIIGNPIELTGDSRDQLIKMTAKKFVEETARYAAKYPDQWRDWEKLKD